MNPIFTFSNFLEITCTSDWENANDKNRFDKDCSKGKEANSNDKYESGTSCTFKCKTGFFRKSGSEKITCLQSGKWDNERAYCEG